MKVLQDSMKPIYVQIAEGIKDDILNDLLKEDEAAYSQNQIAREFNINPATAAKGLLLLVEEGILYKKRGLGMHVAIGAKEMIQEKRKINLFSTLLKELLHEAKKLNISSEEIKSMIDELERGNIT